MDNKTIIFNYSNKKRLVINDFIESIKKDLLQNISKNRGFINKDREVIDFEVFCSYKKNNMFSFYFLMDMDNDEIFIDEFTRNLLYKAYEFDDYGLIYYNENGDLDCDNDLDIKDFFIFSIKVKLYTDEYKILHKKKFYKDLYDDLMVATWHPSRYLDWCIDFEELKFLEEEVFG